MGGGVMAALPIRREGRAPAVSQPGGESDRMWAPFETGNEAAVKHGAYSARVREPRAQELIDWILGQGALRHLHEQSFRPALWRWAQRQAMADLLLDALSH